MSVVFDTGILLLIIEPRIGVPNDPRTGTPVSHAQERVQHLLEELDKNRTTVIIPSPVLAELLVRETDSFAKYQEILSLTRVVEVSPFDARAALEFAMTFGAEIRGGPTRSPIPTSKPTAKFDWQIVAIAKSRNASHLYTTDDRLKRRAESVGLAASLLHELSLPPEAAQVAMSLENDNS